MRIPRRAILCLLLAAWLLPSAAWSQVAPLPVISREYEIKAGVISLVGKFVTWPGAEAPSRERPLTIGVLGQDPFFEGGVNQLDRIVAEERKKGRQIVIERFDSATDYRPCHILYVSSTGTAKSEEKTLKERLDAAKKATDGKPVLLAGDSPGLAELGMVANVLFDRATNRMRLEINPDAASRAGLKLDPQLLRLAKLVRPKN